MLIAASAPPGGGRSELTPRFTRHFHMMCLPPTQEESLNLIFSSILTGFLKAYTFKSEIVSMADSVVSATLDIYNKISSELLPTPAKSHYTFNLRDVSKVFQGILLTRPISVQNTETMVRLWIHETCRVFYDRLVNNEDRTWFKDNVAALLFLYFKVDWTAKTVFEESPVIFVDFMKKGVEMDQRSYEEVILHLIYISYFFRLEIITGLSRLLQSIWMKKQICILCCLKMQLSIYVELQEFLGF